MPWLFLLRTNPAVARPDRANVAFLADIPAVDLDQLTRGVAVRSVEFDCVNEVALFVVEFAGAKMFHDTTASTVPASALSIVGAVSPLIARMRRLVEDWSPVKKITSPTRSPSRPL